MATVVVMLVIFCGGVPAQTAQPDQQAFDEIGEQVYKAHEAPGFAFAVLSHGSVVFAKGYGFADLASKTPVTPDTRFAIGSITKQFTAACALLLAEQGKLSLDDKLAKYVPGMPNADQITLRMLLNQISGLHNYPNTREHDWPRSGTIAPEKIIDILKTDKPDFAPGEKWKYSNTNYAVLAYIVARVSGMTYGEFLQKNIFAPLGMASSGNGFAAQSGTATPYEWRRSMFPAEGRAPAYDPADPVVSLDLSYGAGSVVSTPQDLARWDAALMAGKLLNADLMRTMWTAGTLPNGARVPYAMGFVPAEMGGHREVWHNGYTPKAGGYGYNAIFPDDGLAVVVLSNAAEDTFRGRPEQIVKSVLALYDPRVGSQVETRADSSAGAAQDDPAVHALAMKMLDQMAAGKVDRSVLSAEMNAAVTPEMLAGIAPQLQALGPIENLSLLEKTAMNGGTNYVYAAQFSSGTHKIVVVMTADGKVGGYRVLP
jgi:D-alanyl-D-alanine carboxypeptidase